MSTYILFLNLSYVTINGVRTWTHALLLEKTPGIFGGTQCKVRGFGPDPSWPVFDLVVPSIAYTLTDASGGPMFSTDSHPEGRPLVQGAIMQIKKGPRIDLIVSDYEQDLNVCVFEGKDDMLIMKVWERLESMVTRFVRAPNMPTIRWVSTPGYRRS